MNNQHKLATWEPLFEALESARGRLCANAEYISRSTRNKGNDILYAKAVMTWAREADKVIKSAKEVDD